ncbi:MAG: hypothetical protein KF746_03255 [Chitinophagaceae bacterium]|nr:hypothetical protein [Chitinophagaceae bacterium]
MKLKIPILGLVAFSAIIGFTSCKKNNDTPKENSTEVIAHSDDQALFSSELDAANQDADAVLSAFTVLYNSRNQEHPVYICDAEVDFDSQSDPQTITVTYNGENCRGNRSRSGVVIVAFPKNTKWSDEGAAASVTFQNFKVTRLSDNKSITINGTQTYTNVSGGLLKDLASKESIIHSVSSNGLSVVFDNGAARTWQVAKKHTYTYNNGAVLAVSGMHTEGNETNVVEWGTNRLGLSFTTSTVEPVIVRQDCNFRVTGGTVKHAVAGITATATFGLNAQGEPVSCPEGNYYFKLVYTGPNGNSISFVYPY